MPEPEKKTAADILRILGERVRRIEHDAGAIAVILERMVAAQPERQPATEHGASRA